LTQLILGVVSPKAIPQMQDTAAAITIDLTKASYCHYCQYQRSQMASTHAEIQYLGYPFSISENFQMRNTHKPLQSP
jgi:hydroxymethylglutaryl-CoA lyase